MVDQELLSAIGAMMDEKLDKAVAPINEWLNRLEQGQEQLSVRMGSMEEKMEAVEKRLGAVEDRLGAVEESLEEVRGGVNTLLEWADDVAVKEKIPLRPAQ